MEEEKQVVNADSTPATETQEVVNNAEPTSQQEVAQQEPQTTVAPATNLDVDEFGVPWKNRAMEFKRKTEDLVEKLPTIVEEAVRKVQPQQQATREYSIAELEQYAIQNSDNPNIRAWVEEEKEKIRQKKNRQMFEEIVGAENKKKEVEIKKQQAFEYVAKSYPEAFKRDQSGNLNGWDADHPITQTIGALMQNPDFANNPMGLAAAADIAYGRYMRSQTPKIQNTNQALKQEVRTLQKKSLTEGSGKSVVQNSDPYRATIEKAKQSGSIKDAQEAIGSILRAKGYIG